MAYSKDMVIDNLREQRKKLKDRLEAIKDILKLPKLESAEDTPDIILGFEEQFHLKQILEVKE